MPCLAAKRPSCPTTYHPGDYDLAGFQVGVVDRADLIDGKAIQAGDVVLGLASSGIHSNGYSLVRKIVFDSAQLSLDTHVADLGHSVGEELLRPTTIYVDVIDSIKQALPGSLHAIAHITGGGLQENIERILPGNVDIELDASTWEIPAVFNWLQDLGRVDTAEMQRVFNMGVGMALVVPGADVDAVRQIATDEGIQNWILGEARDGKGVVVYR